MAEKMKSPSGFINSALTGGSGKSSGMTSKSIGRGQTIETDFALDNVKLAMDVPTSLKDESGFGGGVSDLSHSLTGSSAVQDKV